MMQVPIYYKNIHDRVMGVFSITNPKMYDRIIKKLKKDNEADNVKVHNVSIDDDLNITFSFRCLSKHKSHSNSKDMGT